MPWNENNSGGPWGQGPSGSGSGGGGGPRRPNGPNIEELFKQSREQFKGGVPGGRLGLLAILALIVVFWLYQSIYTVDAQEVGVELLFGQPKQELSQSGLHFHFWPIETVEKVTTTQNQTRIGSIRSSGRSGQFSEGLMLTGDQNIVDLGFSVLWRISDPAAYLFNVRDPDGVIRRVAESAMREVVGRRPAQDVFRDKRTEIAVDVEKITQSILDEYGAGINIAGISIEDAAPPNEVADAFDEVQRAEQDEDRFQEEARQYANTRLGQARGEAAQLREEAAAYKDRVVKQAEGEAARFVSVYEEYAKAPEVTRKRLFLETMESVLSQSEKVIMESGEGGTGVVPYLPLPEVQKRSNSNAGR
ncbi:FtsH protease activity modulator HflK [Maritalea mediterranea]|uniref:Protein HflK n=1 Tax=Maritalea mediterranea TaxID=2909667 RepID=A0ABS9EBR3_9HYPH|nr:FtsH protease activity modulator HflK [Maritalea mediterranea]MCF4098896.1 FtsH protease activity modulator HflK [Maritalea mediterranea]